MSAVPGSPKVTRCVSKPWALRSASRTPSAPASAGVTDGQRTSLVRDHFDLALLLPARPAVVGLQQRVGPEPIGLPRAFQEIHFDKTPDAEHEGRQGKRYCCHPIVAEPVRELVIETRIYKERHHPPAALVAVMQPLDRG